MDEAYLTRLTVTPQSELEHQTPKGRYLRTSHKGFIKQLTQIEWRQASIRRLRENLASTGTLTIEDVLSAPEAHHNIGKSQNYPVMIGQFLQRHAGDPAVTVGNESRPNHSFLISPRIFCLNSRSIYCPESRSL